MNKNLIVVSALGFAFALGACEKAPEAPKYTAEDLKAVDLEFSAYSKEHGAYAAFDKYYADDAVGLSGGSQPLIGHDAAISPLKGFPGELTWYPVAADIAKSGDLGYTWGRYVVSYQNAEGETVTGHGKYISIWKLQADGTWKAVVDGGNENPPPEE